MSATFAGVQLRFAVALVVIIVSAIALTALHDWFPVQPIRADLIIPHYRTFVAPKPAEQFVFLVLAVTAPILTWLLVSFWRPRPGSTVSSVLAIGVPALLFCPLFGSDFLIILAGQFDHVPHYIIESVAVAVALSLVVCASLCRRRRLPRLPLSLAWVLFAAAALLQLAAWRLIGFASISRSQVFTIHVDPVFYALSQVVAGKTLLVDLPSQYGMFPELLAPLFRLIGLSVFTLSASFAIMQMTSIAVLFAVLTRLIHSRLVLLATGLALVLVTFETVIFISGVEERYYQYWPIRFVWPALSVGVFYWFLQRRTLRRAAAMSLLSVVGLIWNLDSGLFIGVVFAAYLVARAITRAPHDRDDWPLRRYAAALAWHALIAAAGVGVFWAWLAAKGDGPLNLFWLFGYQRIFYSLGLYLLPLPQALHPWMSVLGVYLLALVSALSSFRSKAPAIRAEMLFYLSMLGLGLFVYYEGRSHVLNLVTVCWPAVLIIGLAADRVLLAVRAGVLTRLHLATPVAALAALFFAAGSFLFRVPTLAQDTAHLFATRGVPVEAFVQSELALIRRHSQPGQQCLILAQRQGIYSAEARLASPIRGPGLIENLLQSEQDTLVASFLSGHVECVFYGIGAETDAGLTIPMAAILEHYRVADRNADDTMLYLVPRL